jgi:hypothetical protein
MKKAFLFIAIIIAITISFNLPVSAYNLMPFNWNWMGANPTVTMKINPNCADATAPNELQTVLATMNSWTTCVANFNLNYGGATSVTNATFNGQNDVCWNPGSSGGALATTTSWYNGANYAQADIVFWDGAWVWSTAQYPSGTQFDVESVGLHEMGHVVGLAHSQYNTAVMWYSIGYAEVQRYLNQDDINGAVFLYGTSGLSLAVTLNEMAPTNLPASGGSIPYSVVIHNNTTGNVFFDAWTEYLNSAGQSQGLLINRPDMTLGSYATIYRYLALTIGNTVPAGTYTYYARTASNYPTPIIDDDYFTFTKATDGDGLEQSDGNGEIAVDEMIPQKFAVTRAYPNPFNPETTIEFNIPQVTKVDLAIYNLKGELVTRLLQGDIAPGQYGIKWNAGDLPSGTYIYLFKTGLGQSSGALVLLK